MIIFLLTLNIINSIILLVLINEFFLKKFSIGLEYMNFSKTKYSCIQRYKIFYRKNDKAFVILLGRKSVM